MLNRFYPESKYGGFSDVDGTILFYIRVNALLQPSFTLLDFGCGRGAYREDPIEIRKNLRIFKNRIARVIGLDVDQVGSSNPFLDEFRLLQNGVWPVQDNSIDICVSDSVIEHLAYPQTFFREARRVIRKGGYLCIRTTNSWGYPALISKLLSKQTSRLLLGKIKKDVKDQDIFPTYYRCNTLPRLIRLLKENKFESVVYGFRAEPSYFMFSPILYFVGNIYQRYAPHFFQPVLFVFSQKKE